MYTVVVTNFTVGNFMVFTGDVRPRILTHEIFNTLNTYFHIVTSDYKRTEQNEEPHSNSEFSHGKLQSTNNRLPTTMSGESSPS